MKKLIAFILTLCLFSNLAFADNCDWTQIKKLPDGGYEYNPTLNLCVGNLVQDAKVKDQQISDLTTAVQLKNAALLAADQRTLLWTKASDDELNNLNQIKTDQNRSDWLMFGLGALTVIGSGFMAAKLIKN